MWLLCDTPTSAICQPVPGERSGVRYTFDQLRADHDIIKCAGSSRLSASSYFDKHWNWWTRGYVVMGRISQKKDMLELQFKICFFITKHLKPPKWTFHFLVFCFPNNNPFTSHLQINLKIKINCLIKYSDSSMSSYTFGPIRDLDQRLIKKKNEWITKDISMIRNFKTQTAFFPKTDILGF